MSTNHRNFYWSLSLKLFLFLLPQLLFAGPITVGSISTKSNEEIKKFTPFARYLASQLRSEGIDHGKVIVTDSVAGMARLLKDGSVDIFIDSPFPSTAVRLLAGTKFILRRWKKGVAEYNSIIFVRKDSEIERLEELRGKIISFEERFSSSGYLLPKEIFYEFGLNLTERMDDTDFPGSNKIGYIFSGEDHKTMEWVLRKRVVSGAMNLPGYLEEAGKHLEDLKIIFKSVSLPRHIISCRGDLADSLVNRIKQVLIDMDKSEEGRRVLQEFERTKRFDNLPEESIALLKKSEKFIKQEFGVE